ncbi:peptidylprolyl isomerase [Flavobacterium aurantiibacter]|uniref:Periplasmic chaperone PpiD n=1 Tax=Flavobacterium aurantiibacter TaxID=2023067 RepID=A0A256A251_9FLAO|nr:peptidylprolyl isomerase [Flavobacterium aurantiibacter]OYQ47205.1 peptidylprolyl isomerase [Flavobacterium aurantiibacter]
MAVLSKIRQRSFLLIAVIGFCLLAFIIGDIFQSGAFNGSSRYVGTVNDEDVSFDDFNVKVVNLEKSQQGMTTTQAANRIWDQEVNIVLLTEEFEKLGIRSSEDQIMDILKQSQDIGQNPMFLNEAGLFDQKKFDEFIKANPAQAQLLNDRRKEAALNAKFQSYGSMIRGGMYTASFEGKLKYKLEADKVSFDYVQVLYSSIKDSDVKVSDEEIIAEMRKDEKRFKAEENVELEYILVEDKPSAEDEAEVKNAINSLMAPRVVLNNETGKNDTIPSFMNAKNTEEFVSENSDIPYDSSYTAKNRLPAEHAEALFNLPVGSVYGPYMFNGYYAISKGMGRKAGANARASHILLSYKGAMRAQPNVTRTKEEAAAKAAELLNEVKANPNSFMMLAMTNSDDGSKQNGGDLGYFEPGQMTTKFNDYVFNNPVNSVGLVETEFGFHVIKVTDKQDAVRLATIARKIEASEQTNDKNFATASKIENDLKSKSIAEVAKTYKLTVAPAVKVKPMDELVGALGNQRQIVRWAYDDENEVGSFKKFDIPNVGNAIVSIKKYNAEGLMALDQARPMLEAKLKNKKKAELIKAKLKGANLAAMAAANKTNVKVATDVTIEAGVLEGVGPEPRVIATAMALGANKLSAPIEGVSGVYVVSAKAVTAAPVIKDYKDYVAKLQAQNGSAPGRILNALKDAAKIEDNRRLFY